MKKLLATLIVLSSVSVSVGSAKVLQFKRPENIETFAGSRQAESLRNLNCGAETCTAEVRDFVTAEAVEELSRAHTRVRRYDAAKALAAKVRDKKASDDEKDELLLLLTALVVPE